jgi:hypothetical protein
LASIYILQEGRKYTWPKRHYKQLHKSRVLNHNAGLRKTKWLVCFFQCERQDVSRLFSDTGSGLSHEMP